MLDVVLSPVAGAIVAVAAYSPLRRGEIEGLRWEDWQNGFSTSNVRYGTAMCLIPKPKPAGQLCQ